MRPSLRRCPIRSHQGQVVLPAEVRRRYGLCPGAELELVDAGDHLVMRPRATDAVAVLTGLLRAGPGERSLVDALLESRRTDTAVE